MDLNLLFSSILYILISVLLLLSIKTIMATKYDAKMSQENNLNLLKQMTYEKQKQEQFIQKSAYLENYNLSLFNKLFEITKELLLTKKSILEEHYN
ncbi:hypothetical protein LX78_02673 [Xanthomarina spongicola]|uniref:Uncharacterized protein n=2 Tax=Xanthomarina spongicola TaxID=570520 RepID=A0A316DHB9_9FLAO|nr:hypothetical protein LX78_02673 [Xanthomarina spongicola]